MVSEDTMSFKEVKIMVNGKEIELNQFVNSFVGNTVYGMVSSLKLDEEPEIMEIKVVKDKK